MRNQLLRNLLIPPRSHRNGEIVQRLCWNTILFFQAAKGPPISHCTHSQSIAERHLWERTLVQCQGKRRGEGSGKEYARWHLWAKKRCHFKGGLQGKGIQRNNTHTVSGMKTQEITPKGMFYFYIICFLFIILWFVFLMLIFFLLSFLVLNRRMERDGARMEGAVWWAQLVHHSEFSLFGARKSIPDLHQENICMVIQVGNYGNFWMFHPNKYWEKNNHCMRAEKLPQNNGECYRQTFQTMRDRSYPALRQERLRTDENVQLQCLECSKQRQTESQS